MSIAMRGVRAGIPAAALLLVLASAPEALAQLGGMGGGGLNTPPVIQSFSAQQVPGQKFRISGTVNDNTPGSCSVTISGAASGTIACDASGNFSAVLDVATPGSITAIASDGQLQSGQFMYLLSNNMPTNSVIAVQGANDTWTFSGTVTDEAAAGLTVRLVGPAGVQGTTATVLSDGTWSVTVIVPPLAGGQVDAQVTDWYGQLAHAYTSF